MASFFPNKLCTDGVDRLNHKWMVVLVLVLALIAIVLPLYPGHSTEGSKDVATSVSISPPAPITENTPEIQCWCPSEFPSSYVNYVNAFCKNALLSMQEGNNDTKSIFDIESQNLDPDGLPPIKESLKLKLRQSFKKMSTGEDNQDMEQEESEEGRKVKSRVLVMVTFRTPLLLVTIALILVVPYMVWSFLSECISPFNLAMTLASASQASTMDASIGNQIYNEISSSVTSHAHQAGKTLSFLYLVKKGLACVVAIALLLVLILHVVPEAHDLEQQLHTVRTAPPPGHSHTKGSDTNDQITGQPDTVQIHTEVFGCQFNIRQLQTTRRFTVQCTVGIKVKEGNDRDTTKKLTTPTKNDSLSTENNLLEFEFIILKIVTALLIILVVGNIVSLAGWLYKLVSTSAMDASLLVQMARINCGADVAFRLARELIPSAAAVNDKEMSETM